MSYEIRDNSKRERRIVRADQEPKDRPVRVMYDVHKPIPLKDQPEVLGEIIGRQLAGLKALSEQGAKFDTDELEQLSVLAKTVVQLATAMKKLQEEPREPTEDELKRIANGT